MREGERSLIKKKKTKLVKEEKEERRRFRGRRLTQHDQSQLCILEENQD